MFPYLDLPGFKRRTAMPVTDVDFVENAEPGYTVQRIAVRSGWINARLRKRYGNSGSASSLPLGQNPPLILSAGTNPPPLTFNGRPTLGSIEFLAQITTPGAIGTAIFRYSLDNGMTWISNVTTAPSIPIQGMNFFMPLLTGGSPSSFGIDNVYSAATPVPEIVLGWLTTLVTVDEYTKRGANFQDPGLDWLKEALQTVLEEVKEAADSKDGLFDLPSSEDTDSAVTTGGPLGCSDASPYAWQDRQACLGSAQDGNRGPSGWRR